MYSRGFKVRLPSQLYLNKTEGLCGNCHSEASTDPWNDDVGLNWLVKKVLRESPYGEEDLCQVAPQPECKLLAPEVDPCLQLLESDLFKVACLLRKLLKSSNALPCIYYKLSRCAMQWSILCLLSLLVNTILARVSIQPRLLVRRSSRTLVNAPAIKSVCLGERHSFVR